MRRIFSSRALRSLLLTSVGFAAGCVTTKTILSDRSPFSSVKSDVLTLNPLPPVDTTDFGSKNSVFSPGPLPEPVVQVGLPGAEPVKLLPGFLCLYDRRTRVPRWTLELITKDSINGAFGDAVVDRSAFQFFEDPGEPVEFRSTNADYSSSGYDRGHMAAAGNNKFDINAMQKTFVLSNIAPQVGVGFNRGIWNGLEKYVRAIARRSANVVIVTGPLFLPEARSSDNRLRRVVYEVIGQNNVAVPTHYFKAIAVQGTPRGPWKTYAWVMPNQYIPEQTRVNKFAVPLKDVERAAGLIIFPNL